MTALLSIIDAWQTIAFCLFGLGPVCVLSHVWLFVTPWTVAHQAPLSVEFSGQEYWSRLPFPALGIFLMDPVSPVSPALAGRFLPLKPPGKTLGLGRGCQTFLSLWIWSLSSLHAFQLHSVGCHFSPFFSESSSSNRVHHTESSKSLY